MIPDKNVLKAAKSAVWSKGFDVKTWRKYRSRKCEGKGVGKNLDMLKRLGLPPNGDIKGIDSGSLVTIKDVLEELNKKTFNDAKKACGSLQKETKEFIEEYQKRIKSLISEIETQQKKDKPGTGTSSKTPGQKTKGETPDGSQKLSEISKKVTPGGNDMQVEKLQNACEEIETKAEKATKTLRAMEVAIGKAHARVEETAKKWRVAFEKEGAPTKKIAEATHIALESFRKQFKIDAIAKEVDGSIAGTLFKCETALKKIKPVGDVKGHHADASDELATAKTKHVSVANALGAFNKLYAAELKAVNERGGNVPKETEGSTPG